MPSERQCGFRRARAKNYPPLDHEFVASSHTTPLLCRRPLGCPRRRRSAVDLAPPRWRRGGNVWDSCGRDRLYLQRSRTRREQVVGMPVSRSRGARVKLALRSRHVWTRRERQIAAKTAQRGTGLTPTRRRAGATSGPHRLSGQLPAAMPTTTASTRTASYGMPRRSSADTAPTTASKAAGRSRTAGARSDRKVDGMANSSCQPGGTFTPVVRRSGNRRARASRANGESAGN